MKEPRAKLTRPTRLRLAGARRARRRLPGRALAARRLQTTYYDTADLRLRLLRWGWPAATGPGRAGRSSCPRARTVPCWSGPSTSSPATGASRPRRSPWCGRSPAPPCWRPPWPACAPCASRSSCWTCRGAPGRAGRRRGPGPGRALVVSAASASLRGRAGRVGRHGPARPVGGPAAGGRRPGHRADRQVPARSTGASACSGPRSRSRRSTATPPSTPCSATTWPAAPCGCSATRRGAGRRGPGGGAPGLGGHPPGPLHSADLLQAARRGVDRPAPRRPQVAGQPARRGQGHRRAAGAVLRAPLGLPAADAKAGPRLLAKLEEQRDQARWRLLGGMASEKYAVLLDDPVAARKPRAGPAPRGRRPGRRDCRRWSPGPGRSCARGPQGRRRPARRAAPPDPHPGQAGPLRRRGGRAGDRQAGRDAFADAIADLQSVLGDHQTRSRPGCGRPPRAPGATSPWSPASWSPPSGPAPPTPAAAGARSGAQPQAAPRLASRPAASLIYRFSLANERTLLAWVRTALALDVAGPE